VYFYALKQEITPLLCDTPVIPIDSSSKSVFWHPPTVTFTNVAIGGLEVAKRELFPTADWIPCGQENRAIR
jgi:hypothetical protein